MNKKMTAIGLTAGLLAGLGAGLALEMSGGADAETAIVAPQANDDTSGSTPLGDSGTNDIALGGADQSHLQDVLQPLVDSGVITQDQADKVIAAIVDDASGAQGGRPGLGGDQGGDRGPGGGMGFGGLDEVATLLGMTTDDLATQLQGGATLAQIAADHGKTAQDVIDVMVQAVKDHFTPEVASGEHTQDEADAMIAQATQQITDFVNNGGQFGPGMGGRGPGDGDHDGGMGGNDGSGGPIDGGPTDPTTQTSADA